MPAPVSVVIPTYRAADVIGRALKSVCDQSLAPAEVIVVDDASPDATLAAVEAYAARLPLHVIRQPVNRGAAAARNAGIAAATQPWIAFLDADDQWRPDKLAVQMAALAQAPATVLCGHAFAEHGPAPGAMRLDAPLPARCATDYWRQLLRMSQFATPTVIVSAAAVRAVGGFGAHVTGEDQDLWLRLALHGPVTALADAVLADVHVRRDSLGGREAGAEDARLLHLLDQWLALAGDRLDPAERQAIRAERLGRVGRNLLAYPRERSRGRQMVLRAARMGYRPWDAMWYLLATSAPIRAVKAVLRGRT